MLDRCVRCGLPLDDPCAFSADGGGGMHAACGAGEPVSWAFLESLEHARRTRLIELLDQAPPEGPVWILARFAEHHLGRGLKSRKWLESLG
jgi:recombinational DNA repair protein (RecF pathway)